MALRMLCTECLELGEPDTVLEGSDRLELLAWCCFAIPGLLYCGWRHLCRCKVCPRCGSAELMRESRATAARRAPQAAPAGGSRVRSLSGMGFCWPGPLRTSRVRLRNGLIGSLLTAFAGIAWLLGALDLAQPAHATSAAAAGWLSFGTWLAWQFQQITRPRGHELDCEAWDEQGRALHIERV